MTALLTACLSLVRPVGMSPEEAEDWLGAGAEAIGHVPLPILDRAALEARRTCTHHSQIVPTIVKASERIEAEQRSVAEARGSVRVIPPAKQLPSRRMTQADVDTMSPQIIKIGLACGALIQDAAGNIIVAPDDAA